MLTFPISSGRPSTCSTARGPDRTEARRQRAAQKQLQREQDGSEVKSLELERLIDIGMNLIGRRDGMESFREAAADRYRIATGSPWTPRAGSRVNHRHLTAALIDSRDFLAARGAPILRCLCPPVQRSPSRAGTPPITGRSGPSSIRSTPSTRTWCCCMGARPRAPKRSRPSGPTAARCRRWPSSPTGRSTPRPRPSSATTRC